MRAISYASGVEPGLVLNQIGLGSQVMLTIRHVLTEENESKVGGGIVGVGVRLGVGVSVAVSEGVRDAVGVSVSVGVSDGVSVGVSVAVLDGV